MKKIFFSLLSLGLFFIGFILWASYPWSLSEKQINSLEVKKIIPDSFIKPEDHPSVLKVLTWNLGFLYGMGSAGDDYHFRKKDFYQKKLESMVKKIREWDVDVIFFQEIDFESSRSHFLNQAEYVAKFAGYPYRVELSSWNSNYIPFPYWPFENHFGKIKSGGAILSRFPLLNPKAFLLSKPESQPWWYNLFYLHRYIQVVEVEISKKKYTLINVHFEAFDKINRQAQIKKLAEIISNLNPLIVAGDFNMVPSLALKKSSFVDGDNYENDQSFDLMSMTKMLEVIPLDIYEKSESKYFTYPAQKPDRRLDYIFYHSLFKMMKADIPNSEISDHLPVRANFQIGPPIVNPYSL